MATYGEPESEIDTFYRQGFYTSFSKPIDMYPLHLTDNLNQLNNLLEESLCAELKAKGFNEDEEGLLVGYGDFQVYIDLDDERIYGFFDDNGKTVVYDLNYQIIDESFEG